MRNRYPLTKRQREAANCFAVFGEEPASLAQLKNSFLERTRSDGPGEGLSQTDYEFECEQEEEHIVKVRSKPRGMEL